MRYMTILTCVASTKVAALDFSKVSFYGPRKKQLTSLQIRFCPLVHCFTKEITICYRPKIYSSYNIFATVIILRVLRLPEGIDERNCPQDYVAK